MRLGEIGGTSFRQGGRTAREPAPESRALVAVSAPAAPMEPASIHREASFLAHLIATKDHHPQTRERRRAEPGEALAAYRATAALGTH